MWKKFEIKFFFAWYDLWIGFYIDTDENLSGNIIWEALYICPLPCCVIKISRRKHRFTLPEPTWIPSYRKLKGLDEK